MRWPLQPLQPLQQTQLQPLFGQSVDSLCHPWFTTTNVSYRLPILPPPPCAALLVKHNAACFHRSKLHFVCQRNVKVHKTPTLFVLRSSLHVASQMSIGHSWCPSQKLDTWTGPLVRSWRKPVTLKLSKLIQDVVEMVVFDLVSDRFASKNSSWDAKNSGARRAWGSWGVRMFWSWAFPTEIVAVVPKDSLHVCKESQTVFNSGHGPRCLFRI